MSTVNNLGSSPASVSLMQIRKDRYPVGSIYQSATVSTSPATVLGFGTWVAITGYTLVGYKSGDTNFGTLGAVAAGEATHTLTSTEMPSHTHTVANGGANTNFQPIASSGVGSTNTSQNTGSTGGGAAHNNIQPSFVVYIWYRSA